jgi:GTPase SAR1 family protein
VVLLGDPDVGKTCVVQRAISDSFSDTKAFAFGVHHNSLSVKIGDRPCP